MSGGADPDADALDAAADAIRRGDLVVYPTETVYGLGADATDADALEGVFEAKERDRSKPVSIALPSVEAALDYVDAADRTVEFMEAFLPGPVTVLVDPAVDLPAALTAGEPKVGVRVPAHDGALALLERVAPVTATSANVSGRPSARTASDLDAEIRAAAAVVLDGGETPGGGSTVVDVAGGGLVRRGHQADAVREWLATH